MLARAEPDASPSLAFTENEIGLLDRLVSDAGNRGAKHGTLSFYLIKLARLGGYLQARATRRRAESLSGVASHA